MRVAHFAGAWLLTAVSISSPVFSAANDKDVVARQNPGSYYAITGATGGVFPRLEIRELQRAGGEMWNLFLLALTEFQAMDQKTIDSYFQIAGIHGMPWTSWDGVEGRLEDKELEDGTVIQKNPDMGYCPHFQVLFGTWHRPYLVLFEQKLQSVAKAIANNFPAATRPKYQDAATKLRVPYWDWAKALPNDQPIIPLTVSNEKTQVTFPNGTLAAIHNPLFNYNFHPLDNTQINGTGCPPGRGEGGRPQICQEYNHTIRGGSFENGDDQAGVNARLRSDLASQRSKLFAVLSQYQTFTQVSSDAFCGRAATVGNIEAVHNNIHIKFAPGHMTPPSVAAFDPIFWLHHANVDRQLAIHQALYPNTYLEQCEASSSTFTIATGDVLNAESPLTPFHKNAAGDFWTSTAVRSIRSQGYTYPELVDNPSNTTLVASIKAQYSGPANISVSTTAPRFRSKRQSSNATVEVKTLYLAEVKLPIYGLDDGRGGASAYSVLLFLGDVSDDPKLWATSRSLVGTAASLGGVHMHSNEVVTSTIDLSLALENAIAAGKTTSEKAEEYLKANLKYRIELVSICSLPRGKKLT
ncbi:Di-copper centre-containing protein [Ophiobolus disseminans]|uniref:tyrosinase n=1 Tax=Ophiobolus disseminans TaxID=1469910 RepID=A0A6A6ZN76_9PLEO|nr:Di-copper centre-containing protein [Ophiobolus disseminans]